MKKQTKVIIAVLIIVLALAGGIFAYYENSPVRTKSIGDVRFNGTVIDEEAQHWSRNFLGGLLKKDLTIEHSKTPVNELGILKGLPLTLDYPKDAESTYELYYKGEILASGNADEYQNYKYEKNGPYAIKLHVHYPKDKVNDEADVYYSLQFGLELDPKIEFSSNSVMQGNILVVQYDQPYDDKTPEISTGLGSAIFIPRENGRWISYVPVGFAQTTGKYDVVVKVGHDYSYTEQVAVTKREYEEQHLTISSSTVASTTGADANKDFNEKIKPTYEIFDPEKYWTEKFIQPVTGRITTQFGLYRYTNGSTTAVRHAGVDIATDKGTPVPASNDGRVVFADSVIRTGNSVVIEHGGGLKTYYYHLDSISVKTGDMVKQGDIIGAVGTTGYSTGPHLHFEVRLGAYPLSPWELFNGKSDIYKY